MARCFESGFIVPEELQSTSIIASLSQRTYTILVVMLRSLRLRPVSTVAGLAKSAVPQRRFAATFVENIKEALKDDEGPLYPPNLKALPREGNNCRMYAI